MLLNEMIEVIVIKAKRLSLVGPRVGLKGESIGEPLFREAAIAPGVTEVIGERLLIFSNHLGKHESQFGRQNDRLLIPLFGIQQLFCLDIQATKQVVQLMTMGSDRNGSRGRKSDSHVSRPHQYPCYIHNAYLVSMPSASKGVKSGYEGHTTLSCDYD